LLAWLLPASLTALYELRRTNTSHLALVSSGTRVEACEENATVWPSAEIAVSLLKPLACWPSLSPETRVVLPATKRLDLDAIRDGQSHSLVSPCHIEQVTAAWTGRWSSRSGRANQTPRWVSR
jgi:hypothetical protein